MLGAAHKQPQNAIDSAFQHLALGARPRQDAVDNCLASVHAEPDALDEGGEMPRVDRQAIGGGLSAHRFKSAMPGPSWDQRMTGEQRPEPANGRGGPFECAGDLPEMVKRSGRPRRA